MDVYDILNVQPITFLSNYNIQFVLIYCPIYPYMEYIKYVICDVCWPGVRSS